LLNEALKFELNFHFQVDFLVVLPSRISTSWPKRKRKWPVTSVCHKCLRPGQWHV